MDNLLDFDPHLSHFQYLCQNNKHEAIKRVLENCSKEDIETKINNSVSDSVADYHLHYRGYTALHFAAENGNEETVKLLLELGANVHAMAYIGTPLHVSIVFCQEKIFHLLLRNGADINRTLNDINPYRMLFEDADGDETVINYWIRLIYNNGCDINYQNRSGFTPLFHAPGFSVETMLKCGADINATNKRGETAFVFQHSTEIYYKHEFYTSACRYIIKLESINFYVNEQNKRFLVDAMKTNCCNEDIINAYKKQCLDTISKLKNIKLSPSISMYNVLHLNATNLSYYLCNKALLEVYEMDNFNAYFYPYDEILKEKFIKAKVRRELLNKATDILEEIFWATLPKLIIKKILSFCSNNVLKKLISKKK